MTYTNISLMTFTCRNHSHSDSFILPIKGLRLCPVEISFMLKDDFVEVLLEELVGKIDKELPARRANMDRPTSILYLGYADA